MKKRILFVDDDPLVLDGLRRMLRPMREEWEMDFCDSGPGALAHMARTPVDVIVSDMRMPGMNGAELLTRVMELHPRTVRLILSGHADRDLILKCVGSTHQYLAKPCDPEAIKATVRRAAATDGALQSTTLKALVGQMSRLPSIPSLYREIVEALQDPEVSMAVVGRIIGRDISMAAQILKLVNSAFFGLRRRVSSPDEAASYLGLDTLRSLVLSLNAFSQFDGVKVEGFSFGDLWLHSLQTGAAAKAVALCEQAGRKLADEAFVSGLLHDTGKVVMAANFPDRYAEVVRLEKAEGLEPCEAERRVFGASHPDVGGYLLGLWGLPVPVVEAIAFHHRPRLGAERTFSPLTAVHVADAFMHRAGAPRDAGPEPRLDYAYLDDLGLAARVPAWREEIEQTASLREAS
ncbi:MAG: HDOD domain-containing protein [Opitutaceae bacterium]|nr:HDOD domain-containing protein [Opitutaceae bacterium]